MHTFAPGGTNTFVVHAPIVWIEYPVRNGREWVVRVFLSGYHPGSFCSAQHPSLPCQELLAPTEWILIRVVRTNDPKTMKNLSVLLLFLTSYTLDMQAQDPVGTSSKNKDPREQCLMATGADWGHLGIGQEQILGINSIQATCMKDCEVARGSDTDVTSVMDRHIAELRKVLTPEQFNEWDAWCKNEVIGSSGKEDGTKGGGMEGSSPNK